MIVVSLFDFTGNIVQPWLQAGHECFIVDIKHNNTKEGDLYKVKYDLSRPWLPPISKADIGFVFAFPPCDHLAASGAKWFKGKGLRLLSENINFFATAAEFAEWAGAPYMIENPVSTISTYWRKPDYIFNPYDYTGFFSADNYSKKTCLWTGNGFIMPEENRNRALPPPDDRIYKMSDNENRKRLRSATPMGFAKAVFKANI